ncbi:hypothetical protein [Bradyrhizobium sp. 45]|uniref:hypothetical protein n=1 Tax=Bradyrhizobium sp. 45 TaxID=1043587 RepID=UPI001FFBC91C|nr:hypothetical protein [Bradyrhizobium sp. 45]MCK1305740.1 hypothetical protein [Bradyrhizobium sp. 45]
MKDDRIGFCLKQAGISMWGRLMSWQLLLSDDLALTGASACLRDFGLGAFGGLVWGLSAEKAAQGWAPIGVPE